MVNTRKTRRQRKNINSLIPMEHADLGRTFVNAWDVPERETEGWKVIGSLKQHMSTTKAPVDLLHEANEKAKAEKAAAEKAKAEKAAK